MQITSKINNFYKHNKLLKIIEWVFFIALGAIILLAAFGPLILSHKNLSEFFKNNWIFFVLGGILAIVIALICSKLKFFTVAKQTNIKHKTKWYKRFVIISSVVILALMFFICFGRLFITGWDVWYLFFDAPETNEYFSTYPNNIFLFGVHKLTLRYLVQPVCNLVTQIMPGVVGILNNISADAINYCLYVAINIILVYATILFIACVVRKMSNEKIAAFAFIASSIFIGLMPWIAVPYSDISAMFFITFILWAYICVENTTPKIILISTLTVIGFNIKPTVIFITFSIVVVELVRFICLKFRNNKYKRCDANKTSKRENHKKNQSLWKVMLKNIAICLLSIAVTFSLVKITSAASGVDIDKNKEFSPTHFLMMGLNTETEGLWSQQDVTDSSSCQDTDKRTSFNISEISKRLNQMGPVGFARLIIKKTMCNYGDGSFSWELDAGPNFYKKIITNNSLIENIYNKYKPEVQVLWFAILIGALFVVFRLKKLNSTSHKFIIICSITLLCQTAFLALFECGSRYLILDIPLIMVLAIVGWVNLFNVREQNE